METILYRARLLWREKRDGLASVGPAFGLVACLASIAMAPRVAAMVGSTIFWPLLAVLAVWAAIELFSARRGSSYGIWFCIATLLWLAALGLAIGGIVDYGRRPANTVLLAAILMALGSGRRLQKRAAPIARKSR